VRVLQTIVTTALFPICIQAQWLNTRVSGRVTGYPPSEPVRVQMQQLGMTLQEQFTRDGRFSFLAPEAGRYSLLVEIPGRPVESMEIEVPGANEIVIQLRDDGAERRQTGVVSSILDYQVPRSARREFESARKKARKGDCAGAIERLQKAVRIFPEYIDAHDALGYCYQQLKQPERAEESYNIAIGIANSVSAPDGDPFLGLANMRFDQARFVEAEELAREAHRRPRHQPDAHLLLAKIHQSRKETDLIISELQVYVLEAPAGPLRSRVEKMLEGASQH